MKPGSRAWIRRKLAPIWNTRWFQLIRGSLNGARRAWQKARRPDYRVVRLPPEGVPRGRVLFSYCFEGLLEPDVPNSHTAFWKSATMARLWAEQGFHVDVVDNENPNFVPDRDYDFAVATIFSLERIARGLNPGCVKILHVDFAHWLFNNAATHERALAVQRRRGVTLSRLLTIPRNHAIEVADCVTSPGTAFTAGTYAYSGKPLFSISGSAAQAFEWPEEKDFEACKGRFVWFGSRGALHKGLDRVLEAFAGMPDLQLTVIGPIAERDFEEAYRRELYEIRNIRSVGWVDLAGPMFKELADEAVAVVFPSCAEGQSGTTIACMHAGLIPVITAETSVAVDPSYGIVLESGSVEEIRAAVRGLSGRPAAELEVMARGAWEFARREYSREAFISHYREIVSQIIEMYGPTSRARATAHRPR